MSIHRPTRQTIMDCIKDAIQVVAHSKDRWTYVDIRDEVRRHCAAPSRTRWSSMLCEMERRAVIYYAGEVHEKRSRSGAAINLVSSWTTKPALAKSRHGGDWMR